FTGDDVVAIAAVNGSDAQDHRLIRIDAAAADGLKRRDAPGGHHDRIDTQVRIRRMYLLAADGDVERIGGSERRARRILHRSRRRKAPDMEPEDGVRTR